MSEKGKWTKNGTASTYYQRFLNDKNKSLRMQKWMPHSEDNYPRYQQVASYIHTQYCDSDFFVGFMYRGKRTSENYRR